VRVRGHLFAMRAFGAEIPFAFGHNVIGHVATPLRLPEPPPGA